ncbi:MAG: hypothetical protein ACE5I4_04770 [Thermoplasmata archaeon]
MAWSYEAKAGIGWMVILLILMVFAQFIMVSVGNELPLLLPIAGYVVFAWWVFRVM